MISPQGRQEMTTADKTHAKAHRKAHDMMGAAIEVRKEPGRSLLGALSALSFLCAPWGDDGRCSKLSRQIDMNDLAVQ